MATRSSRQIFYQLKYLRVSVPKMSAKLLCFTLDQPDLCDHLWSTGKEYTDQPSAYSELRGKVSTCTENGRGVPSPRNIEGVLLEEGGMEAHQSNNCPSYLCLQRWTHIVPLACCVPFPPPTLTHFPPILSTPGEYPTSYSQEVFHITAARLDFFFLSTPKNYCAYLPLW